MKKKPLRDRAEYMRKFRLRKKKELLALKKELKRLKNKLC